MKIHLKFFAALAETLGTREEMLEIEANIATLTDLRQQLANRSECWQTLMAPHILCALNHQVIPQYAAATTLLTDNCEVAFFPPVSGG